MSTKLMKTASVFDIDAVAILASQVEALNKNLMVNPMMPYDANGVEMINLEGSPFKSNIEHEQVDFLGNNSRPQNNPYCNTYKCRMEESSKIFLGWSGKSKITTLSKFLAILSAKEETEPCGDVG
ncbi:Retrotransposon gag protein [Gossypium australe]|uniref:Retrotransposon gag protein n=1 Tax=Gossypium australe TaxID=47621 RepID=A0A5B6VYV1_9ROSI|nr:Retrotransposon gag protein [Gossypium australe]